MVATHVSRELDRTGAMSRGLCPRCAREVAIERAARVEKGFLICQCHAVLGAEGDIVARVSDGRPVFDPGLRVSTPAGFSVDLGKAPRGGYRTAPGEASRPRELTMTFALPRHNITLPLAVAAAMTWLFALALYSHRELGGSLAVRLAVSSVAWLPALAFTYATLAFLLDRCSVKIRNGALWVGHGPLPRARGRSLLARDIDQIVALRSEREAGGLRSATYSIQAMDPSGQASSVLEDISDIETAAFIARTIQCSLGLEAGPTLDAMARRDEAARSPRRIRLPAPGDGDAERVPRHEEDAEEYDESGGAEEADPDQRAGARRPP